MTCIFVLQFFVGFGMFKNFLRVLGGVGGTVGVDDLGIKDSEAVAMPETNNAFVSAGVGFGSEGGGADLIEGGVSGIVGILMSPEEDRRFMDDGF